jgi:hypothetical protein
MSPMPPKPKGSDVVAPPLLGVGQHLVGVGHLLEQGLGLGVAVPRVGVELARQLAVGALDLLLRGGAGHTEDLVVVAAGQRRSLSPR